MEKYRSNKLLSARKTVASLTLAGFAFNGLRTAQDIIYGITNPTVISGEAIPAEPSLPPNQVIAIPTPNSTSQAERLIEYDLQTDSHLLTFSAWAFAYAEMAGRRPNKNP